MTENERFQARIRDLVRPLAGLDLQDGDHRALVRVADLDDATATTVARLLRRARQARPLRIPRS
ncbi:hypothetical protein EV188_102514 [Actinomycetospora succinea]|uniref:Uncharacterized protein n=1 Tax=Actinomycetospora succinea TaxID=663603 RepID=A0A4R6VHP7_9PSEU|nr:hypothetical protein EV188_102514 [Actinomycetospora succinea]